MRIHVDKIGSATRNLKLSRSLTLSDQFYIEPGSVIACRIHGEKSTYNQLEDPHGRLVTLHQGDLVVGALGHRNALHGYEGVMPTQLRVGDTLHMLNMGGVMGLCQSYNPDVGAPFRLEVLGQVMQFPEFQSRIGQPAHISMGALPLRDPSVRCPVVYIAGTCMNAGKTAACCAVIRNFSQRGLRIGGVKLTGVSLQRDILSMRDYGASEILDFTDAGIVCTSKDTAAATAKTLLTAMSEMDVDLIVAETGDGILGEYGVQSILSDPDLNRLSSAFILCANDPVGALGGIDTLQKQFGIKVDIVAGPVTDNRVGERFVESLQIPARNARSNPKALGDLVFNICYPTAQVAS
jgi:hypothetical protein